MADLHACYFCGAAGEAALESYPVVPDALTSETDPASRSTVVLCPGCKTKLDDVLEAAFATVDAAPAADPPEDPPWGSHAGVPGAIAPDEGVTGDGDGDETGTAEALSDAARGTPEGDQAEPEVDPSSKDRSSDAEVESDAADDGEEADAADDGEEADASAEAEAGSTADVDGVENGPADAGATAPTEDLPPVTPTTRKVIRLVQNREFPLDRAELEDVAQSAYELSREEATEAVETIVAHGGLEADGDELKKP